MVNAAGCGYAAVGAAPSNTGRHFVAVGCVVGLVGRLSRKVEAFGAHRLQARKQTGTPSEQGGIPSVKSRLVPAFFCCDLRYKTVSRGLAVSGRRQRKKCAINAQ
ncbi:MAG: hypothetical protein H3C55_12400 [Pseudorhodoplanes sp.]|nr:hypothetical protein [Pseudorhodoplanes sp.]